MEGKAVLTMTHIKIFGDEGIPYIHYHFIDEHEAKYHSVSKMVILPTPEGVDWKKVIQESLGSSLFKELGPFHTEVHVTDKEIILKVNPSKEVLMELLRKKTQEFIDKEYPAIGVGY
jgi:hypothetical protein